MTAIQRLAGKAAIVTGTASDIGLASVRLFVAEGACVVAVDLPGSGVEAAFIDASKIGAQAISVTDDDVPQAMLATVVDHWGGLDILFNNASIMATYADYGCAAYAASKHGLAGLTKALAIEVGPAAVTADYILPCAIRTGLTQALFDNPAVCRDWEASAAIERLAELIDIARAALLLAKDETDFITGHGLVADGSLSLHRGPLLPN